MTATPVTGLGIAENELRADRPIIAPFDFRVGGDHHMVVISGVDLWWQDYRIMDPSAGYTGWVSANRLHSGSSADMIWRASIIF